LVRPKYLAALLILAAPLAAGCDDGTGYDIHPILVNDTVIVAAPIPQTEGLPTALDITPDGFGNVYGGRFPERPRDALEWDFLVRIEDGEIVLVPGVEAGTPTSQAALTPPIEGETFESLRETPGQSTFRSDTTIAMVEGAVYAARSRALSGCTQFAKMEPLEVDVANGVLEIQLVTNQLCGDARLVPLD
jgi:hypothetical protein